MRKSAQSRLRIGSIVAAFAVVLGTLLVAQPALAESAPADPTNPATPATVTADALPTPQIDGVVWTQTVVGNTVFVGGKFSTVRPYGAASGVNTSSQPYLMSYNVTTGAWNSSFRPTLDAQVRAIVASADGTKIYVSGSFTKVNGVARARVAELDATTGALISTFNATPNYVVNALAIKGNTLWIGGAFASVGGATRGKVAAVNATTGAVLPFVATAAGGDVTSLAVSPDGSKVVVGGNFTTLNGSGNPGYGLGAVDSVTGALVPWAMNSLVRNATSSSSITSLVADSSGLYGSGYRYTGNGGNLEGSFRADWATGQIIWLEDCHGDTYSVAVTANAEYVAGHPHYCGNVGGFPQTSPTWTFHRGIAFSKEATQTVTTDNQGYYNFAGTPAPSLLNWYPEFNTGSYTGQTQGPWSVAASADSNYVVYGGEFTTINGRGQEGLTRFAVASLAPNKVGPLDSGSSFTPSLVSLEAGSVRVRFSANGDPDSQALTYVVYRDGNMSKPVFTTTADSSVWNRPLLGFTDTGLVPGSTHSYRVRATDSFGNTVIGDGVNVTVTTKAASQYATTVLAQNPTSFWRFDEASGTTVYDWAGYSDQVAGTGVTRGATGGSGDGDTASTFSGADDGTGVSTTQTAIPGPQTFTVEAWIKTTTTAGGKIVGFGNKNSTVSTVYDRHLYMDTSGKVSFGVYPGTQAILTSPAALNDGQWHQVIGTLGSTGQQLFVDGKRVGSSTGVTSARVLSGYWKVGGDSTWSGAKFFNGQIDDVSVYDSVLSRAQVNAQYVASGRPSTLAAPPTDTYGAAVFDESPDLYWRFGDTAGSTVAADSGLAGVTGVYAGGATPGAPGGLSGTSDTSAAFNGSTGQVYSSSAFVDPQNYSLETWFKTTSTKGGRLIGFGNVQAAASGTYDRQVYLQDNGQIVYGTFTTQKNLITSPASYNDGTWHSAVATQSSAGLKLYVDGALVASNPSVTAAKKYTGYWKVGGGDSTWGSTSKFLNGSIDEVAVYDHALTGGTVAQHWALGTGTTPNVLPRSAFTATPAGFSAALDGGTSSDTDGTISSYAWDFGDGTSDTTTGATPTHVYSAAGTYTVTLTVTDNRGGKDASTQQVVIVPPHVNDPPTASLTTSVTGMVLTATSTSTDPDGSIASTSWNYGDGSAAGTGISSTHTYAAAGTYTVSVTVTDDSGATDTASTSVVVQAAPVAPVAAFTSTASDLTAAFDGTTSTDPDGSVRTWAWDFGDGSAGTGSSVDHTYRLPNTYTVTLSVTDDSGLTNSTSRDVTVTAPPTTPTAVPFALDTFNRTLSGGLGTADVGGAWTKIAGNAAQLKVAIGVATLQTTGPGASVGAQMNSVAQADTDLVTQFSLDKAATGGGFYVYVSGRKVATNNDYRATVRLKNNATAAISITAYQNAAGVTVAPEVVIPGTVNAGTAINVRMQVTGTSPTTIRAKAWLVGTDEPTAWTVQATDSTPTVQKPGSVGIAGYDSGSATNGAKVLTITKWIATKP